MNPSPKPTCTYIVTKTKHITQMWAPCYDCFDDESEGACERCLEECHAGHNIGYTRTSNFFCDCGANNCCTRKSKGPPKQTKPKEKLPPKAEVPHHQSVGKVTIPKNFYGSTNSLGLKLVGAMETNFLLSPLSIAYIMSMLHLGASGNTDTQLTELMGRRNSLSNLKTAFDLFNKSGVKLANAIFVRDDAKIHDEYFQAINENKLALISAEDFGNPAAVAEKANYYVQQATKKLIKNIVKKDTINNNTLMLIINTVYFKAPWAHPFDKYPTKKEKFNQGKSYVQMMRQVEYFPYYEDDSVQIVELPYEGGEFCMGIILPCIGKTGIDYEEYLMDRFKDIQYKEKQLNLYIPKFTHRKNIDLIPLMQKLGVTDLITKNCRLDRMVKEPVYVSAAIHEAVVIVDEFGTEAAASTAVHMSKSALKPTPKLFYADHSFMYYIKHIETGTMLFIGFFNGV